MVTLKKTCDQCKYQLDNGLHEEGIFSALCFAGIHGNVL